MKSLQLVSGQPGAGDSSPDPLNVPSTFTDMSAVASAGTVWTVNATKRIRLLGGTFSVSAAGSALFTNHNGGGTVFRTGKLEADKPYTFDLGGRGILLAALGDDLDVTLSGGGTITGTLYGCEEPV